MEATNYNPPNFIMEYTNKQHNCPPFITSTVFLRVYWTKWESSAKQNQMWLQVFTESRTEECTSLMSEVCVCVCGGGSRVSAGMGLLFSADRLSCLPRGVQRRVRWARQQGALWRFHTHSQTSRLLRPLQRLPWPGLPGLAGHTIGTRTNTVCRRPLRLST